MTLPFYWRLDRKILDHHIINKLNGLITWIINRVLFFWWSNASRPTLGSSTSVIQVVQRDLRLSKGCGKVMQRLWEDYAKVIQRFGEGYAKALRKLCKLVEKARSDSPNRKSFQSRFCWAMLLNQIENIVCSFWSYKSIIYDNKNNKWKVDFHTWSPSRGWASWIFLRCSANFDTAKQQSLQCSDPRVGSWCLAPAKTILW